ncbi:hypothetical protein ACLOJK_020434 [Asimina triloba]
MHVLCWDVVSLAKTHQKRRGEFTIGEDGFRGNLGEMVEDPVQIRDIENDLGDLGEMMGEMLRDREALSVAVS